MADGPASESPHPPPPLPPPLRPKPQRRQIGAGKPYATVAEFDADVAIWSVEKHTRKELVKLRAKELDKRRDRSDRIRDKEGETDSQRRVRQRREDKAARQAHADREWDRRAGVRAEKQMSRFNALNVDLATALRDCIVHEAKPRAYEVARLLLDRVLCQMRFVLDPDEGWWPDGSFEWADGFEDAAEDATSDRKLRWRERSWIHSQPALERWQVEILMRLPPDGDWDGSYDADANASSWDLLLSKNPAVAGTPAAAISGRDIVDFILKQKRKWKAETRFEAHLKLERQKELTSLARKWKIPEVHIEWSASSDGKHRDKSSESWIRALGDQWRSGREKPTNCPCTCYIYKCRCAIGCVLDDEENPVQPLRFAPSSKC